MTKNGTQNFTTSWAKATSWTANTGTYPGSTVVNNDLQVQGSKSDATITVSLPYTGSFSYTRNARILHNGVVIATGAGWTTTSGTLSVTATDVSVADGDDISVEIIMNTFGSGSISNGGTVTITQHVIIYVMGIENKGIRTKSIKRVRQTNYGLYVWVLPNGKPVMDDEGNVLNIPSRRDDIVKMAQLKAAAKYWGYPDGEPRFMESRRLTDEEFEAEIDGFVAGEE